MASARTEAIESTLAVVLPEGPYEIVEGLIVEKPPMSAYARWLANQIAWLLKGLPAVATQGHVLVEVLFDLGPAVNRSRQPDVCFLSFERWPRDQVVPETDAWPIVPDHAIEIISPSNTAALVREKVREYFAAGVRRVWVVYPSKKEVEDYDTAKSVRILDAEDELDATALWPGVRLSIERLFSPA